MSNAAVYRSKQNHVNVTLEPSVPQANPLFGKKYPCCLCGNGLEIRLTRKNGSAQEFVKICNWRGFQNAGLRRLGDGCAIMGRWCGGFIRGDAHEPRPSRHSFLGEGTPQSAGRKSVRL